MEQKLHTPEGVRDIYNRECAIKLALQKKLNTVLHLYGYQDIQTPTFESFDVFSRAELESRAEIKYEIYSKAINIEAKTMIDMATKQIIPAVIRYTTVLGESINTVKTAGEGLIDVSVQLDLLKKASKLLKAANSAMSKLSKLVEKIPEYAEGRDRAIFCREKVVPAMEALREPVDELEMIVDKEMWPMPSYGDLIFEV